MNKLDFAFFALASLLVLLGGVGTVAARNPIRGAMGLLTTILGIAGMYLLLSAEFLAAIQILVYAGAVVILFIFVIMLLGPSATSGRDTRGWVARYIGAGVFIAAAIGAVVLVAGAPSNKPALPQPALAKGQDAATPQGAGTPFPAAPKSLGTVEGVGKELFSADLTPFELSSALLLVAVVGAVAVARGRQPDPTLKAATPTANGGELIGAGPARETDAPKSSDEPVAKGAHA